MGRQPVTRATGSPSHNIVAHGHGPRVPHQRALQQGYDVASSAKGYIDDFFGMTAAEAAGTMVTSRAASLGSGALAAFGFAQTLWDIISSAIDLLQFDEGIVRDIASSHAFGYWLFAHRQFPYPAQPPQAMQARDERSDAFNVYDHFSADDARDAWRLAVGQTRNGLTARLGSIPRSHLEAELYETNQAIDFMRMTTGELHAFWKINLCARFSHDPRAAAGAFMMKVIDGRDATVARVLRAQYRHYAYDPRDATA